MKVVVTEMPEEPKDCLFSEFHLGSGMYLCTLRAYIPEADRRDSGYKPKCVCRSCDKCDKLEVSQ